MPCGQKGKRACNGCATTGWYHSVKYKEDKRQTNTPLWPKNCGCVILWHQPKPLPLTSVRVIIRPTSPRVASSTVKSITKWGREKIERQKWLWQWDHWLSDKSALKGITSTCTLWVHISCSGFFFMLIKTGYRAFELFISCKKHRPRSSSVSGPIS